MRRFVFIFTIGMSLYHLLYALDFFELFEIFLFGHHRGLSYAFILGLCFLLMPATKKAPRDRLPWYDALLFLVSLAPSLYFFYHYDRMILIYTMPGTIEVILGVILFGTSLEAARRTLGLPLVFIAIFFIFYTKYANYFPGIMFAAGSTWPRVVGQLAFAPEGIFGIVMELFATVIAIFIIFAQFVVNAGAGEFFLNLGFATMGRYRGGPAKAAVMASASYGTISGVAVANVATTGSFTIPLMKRTGYSSHFAGAVEAVSSTGGVLMPPVMGVIAFFMADLLQISYWSIVVAAFIPAALYYLAVFVQVDFEAAKMGLRGLPRSELPSFWATLRDGWQFFLPVATLVYLLAFQGYTPVRSGLAAMVVLVAVSFLRKRTRMNITRTLGALEGGALGIMKIGPAAGVVGIIMGSVAITALGVRLSGGLVEMAGGNKLVLLLLAAGAAFVLGTGLDLLTTYIVMAVMVAPALIAMDVPQLAAHLFMLYFAVVALITPPVCLSVYAASAIADSNVWRTGLQAVRLGIVAMIVPFIFVYNQALIMQGPALEIIFAVSTAVMGVVALAGALEGYFLLRTRLWERLALGGAGVLLLFPGWQTDIAGMALLAAALIAQLLTLKLRRQAPVPGTGGIGVAQLDSESTGESAD